MSTPIAESLLGLDYQRSWGTPPGKAKIRCEPEDFVVEERFDGELSGDGDHLCLHIRKRNQNTAWVAAGLAGLLGVETRDVGYCGLKDRRALTSQWFSIRVLDQNADLRVAQWAAGKAFLPDCRLLAWGRHRRKIRRGDHRGNDFRITLRQLESRHQELEQRLAMIKQQGVPNYFGEQRFGRQGANLLQADHLLTRRSRSHARGGRGARGGGKEGLYLSAARSHLFNRVLSARVGDGSWQTPDEGERVATGPLWGRGRPPVSPALGLREQEILRPYETWRHALEHRGLNQERRSLALLPDAFSWQWRGTDMTLSFGLPPGAYATAVLRELVFTRGPKDDAVL